MFLYFSDLVHAAGAEGTVEEAGATAKTVKTAGIAEVKKKMEVSQGIAAAVKREVRTWGAVKETGA